MVHIWNIGVLHCLADNKAVDLLVVSQYLLKRLSQYLNAVNDLTRYITLCGRCYLLRLVSALRCSVCVSPTLLAV